MREKPVKIGSIEFNDLLHGSFLVSYFLLLSSAVVPVAVTESVTDVLRLLGFAL